MNLAEYAAKHPQDEPQQETARSYHDRQQERERVEQIKESIAHQLKAGNAPQYILYPALEAIGILTHDPEWTQAGQKALDTVYDDLAQQSMLTDTAAVAARRLDTMQQQYNDRLRRQLRSQLNGYRRIEKALQDALQAADELIT